MSRLARIAVAIAIILGGQWLASQPDIYMPLFDAIREEVIMTNDAEIVEMQDDCLLYTSPSPRDGLLSRMPSSA